MRNLTVACNQHGLYVAMKRLIEDFNIYYIDLSVSRQKVISFYECREVLQCDRRFKMPAGVERLLRKVSGYHEFLAECIFTKKLLGIEQLFTIVYFPYMDLQT